MHQSDKANMFCINQLGCFSIAVGTVNWYRFEKRL